MSTGRDPERLRTAARVDLRATDWHAFEPVLDALTEKGFDLGTPISKGAEWSCEYGPFRLVFAPGPESWAVSMAVNDDNVTTRALLKTLDQALRALPGVQRVEWYKREEPTGAPAPSPIQP